MSGQVYWNSGGVWVRPRKPEQTEMEYQMRNWYYFNWLCGDHIVEQHVHNIDVANWVKGSYAVSIQGPGSRTWRTGKEDRKSTRQNTSHKCASPMPTPS